MPEGKGTYGSKLGRPPKKKKDKKKKKKKKKVKYKKGYSWPKDESHQGLHHEEGLM